MTIEVKIKLERVENWGVNWDDPNEEAKALMDLKRDIKIQMLKIGVEKVKVANPIIYKPYNNSENSDT